LCELLICVKMSTVFQGAKKEVMELIAPKELDPISRGMCTVVSLAMSPLVGILFGLKYWELRKEKKKAEREEREYLLA
jgi:hypothetical protein